MADTLPLRARGVVAAPGRGADEPETPRCPRCGAGDLYALSLRRNGRAEMVTYCAGLYDRARRRVLRRSCGYSGGASS